MQSSEQSAEHSRLAEEVIDARVLDGLRRAEVQEQLGKGEPCSRHPRCAENGFEPDDWYYEVGQMGAVQAPVLIIGFDRSGQVHRTWQLRTH